MLVLNSTLLFFAEQTYTTFNTTSRIWFYERGPRAGFPTPFQSIYQTFWWCFVTLTFMGYGDEVPQSPLGRAVAVLTVASAIFAFLFPIAVVLSRLTQEVSAYRELKSALRLRDMPANEVLLKVFTMSQDMNAKMTEMRKTQVWFYKKKSCFYSLIHPLVQKTLGILLYKLGKAAVRAKTSTSSEGLGAARVFSQSAFVEQPDDDDDIEMMQ